MPLLTARTIRRRAPVGAEVQPGGGVHFRTWAPLADRVEVVLQSAALPQARLARALEKKAGGYFCALIADASPGMRYRFRLDGGEALPDPASRFQPDGPHGDSVIIDPATFVWTDQA
ncbi:MAG TPA: hypothetical protein VFY80_03180, partial [Burkholderiales bacterium]|nr:hypothetical protein [Burkholderiales bacterium]